MRIQIFARNVTLEQEWEDFIERRLRFAIGRFASRIQEVIVRIRDLNGPRGGIDQHCLIDAHILPSARKSAKAIGPDLGTAISKAVDRISRCIRTDLDRRRTRRIRGGKRLENPTLR
ncbi:MAG: HPF/RaiA family ribosome-associated protein [Phycisphaerae bacterium]